MKNLSIEQRVQKLEDKEAIKDITYQYASYVNQGWNGISINPNGFSEIFMEDAIWESQMMNIREVGLENIRKSVVKETQTVLFVMHSYTNPIIKIDGNTATGNWLFWIASKMGKDITNQVFMSQDIRYTKTESGWRIQEIKVHFGEIIKNKKQD